MTYQNIILEQREPGIYLLTLNRPQALNALNAATLGELAAATAVVAADAQARVLLVTGAGEKAFVAGADISEMQHYAPEQARAFSDQGMRLMAGLDVRLPEEDVDAALKRLAELDRDKKILSRDITAVDLRLADRVIVRLSDAAAKARDDALKALDKKGKRKGGDA
jgi:1,4-dihydroxy-2-naphthoyl-CoA synthase